MKDKNGQEEKCYILVLSVDTDNGYVVKVSTKIHPSKPQISKIMYKKNYGLIMACYRGYIERFDSNNFKSVSKWVNNMKAIGSEKLKAKAAKYESNKRRTDEFEDMIIEELRKRDIVNDNSASGF